MQAYAADFLAILFGSLALGATLFGRLPQRVGFFGMNSLRDKGAVVGAGAAALPACAVAYEFAGPGSLIWFWVAMTLGTALLGRKDSAVPPAKDGAAAAQVLEHARPRTYALCFALVLSGAWLMRASLGLGAGDGLGNEGGWTLPLLLWGVSSVVLVLAPPASFSARWLRVPTLVLVLACVWVALSGERSLAEVWQRVVSGALDFTALAAGTATGGAIAWLAVGVQQGALAASHALGLGYTENQAEARHARQIAGATALNATLVATVAVFAMDAAPASSLRLDHIELRTQDGRPRMMPAERAQSRASLPSPKGQTIVLPTDTELEPELSYRALFRADPRGYKAALFSETRNAYAVAKLDSTVGIEAIYFRDKDALRSKSAAWDLRVEVSVEELDVNNATRVLQLTPKDPNLSFEMLRTHYSGPYLPLKDIELELVAKKAAAGARAIGPHIALVQPNPTGPVTQYSLQQLVPMGFRGPFFDLDRPAAPMVFVADAKLSAELGARLASEFRAPEAGLEMGIIRASGQLELPGWETFEDLSYVVFHHKSGERKKSFMVPVQPASPPMVNGHARFETVPDSPTTLHKASKLSDYQGPFVVPGPQRRWLEVRSGTNLADAPGTALPQRGRRDHPWANAKILVPLTRPTPPSGFYEPSPAELVQAGMRGPFVPSPRGSVLSKLGALALVAAWLAWAAAAWVMLPTFPKLRAILILGGVAGILLPFEFLYALWLLAAAILLVLSWSRRARPAAN